MQRSLAFLVLAGLVFEAGSFSSADQFKGLEDIRVEPRGGVASKPARERTR